MSRNMGTLPAIAMIAMAILSFANLFGLRIASVSVFIGVAFFFITKASERAAFDESGLDIKSIGAGFRVKGIWLWLVLPTIMDAVSAGLSKFVLPQYVAYELARAGAYVTFDKVLVLLPQLAVLALGEEIAWRAFFQRQLTKAFPATLVIFLSSVLFALGHWTVLTPGDGGVVAYSVFFVFINSILYGVIFRKTNNAWVSAISHFVANLLSVVFLPFFA